MSYATPLRIVIGWAASVPIVGPILGYCLYLALRYSTMSFFIVDVIISSIVGVTITLGVLFGTLLVYEDYRREHTDFKTRSRARELLLKLLDPEQRAQYENCNSIVVHLADGGFAVIGDHISGIDWDTRKSRGFQCVHIPLGLCKEDDLIAKLLWLRTSPQEIAAVSNRVIY